MKALGGITHGSAKALGNRGGWGCRIATAIGLGLVAWIGAAFAATVLEVNGFGPALLGLAVAAGVGIQPFLARAAGLLFGVDTASMAHLAGDLLLAGIGIATLVFAAWLSGSSVVTFIRERPGDQARCMVREYRWLGRALSVEWTVEDVKAVRVEKSDPTGVKRNSLWRRQVTPNYALVLDTANGPLKVKDASRPSAAAAVDVLTPVLSSGEPGRADAEIVDWVAPAFAGILGAIFALLSIRRILRRIGTRRCGGA